MTSRPVTFALLLLASTLQLGCAANPWEASFEPAWRWNDDAVSMAFDASAASSGSPGPSIRVIELDRLHAYLDDLYERQSASDAAFQDWLEDQKRAERQRLIETLRIPRDVDDIAFLGTSWFVDERKRPSRDPELIEFAQKLGADYVVVGIEFIGRRETVRSYPQTTHSTISIDRTYRTKKGWKREQDTGYETTTTYVPVRVTVDQYQHVAYFCRSRRTNSGSAPEE
jgi:hypothetical protein